MFDQSLYAILKIGCQGCEFMISSFIPNMSIKTSAKSSAFVTQLTYYDINIS